MKKYLALIFLLVLVFSFTACLGSGMINIANLAEEASPTTTTTISETTTGSSLTYDDYDSLKQALYEEIYASLYTDLYNGIESALFDPDDENYSGDLYTEIYNNVIADLEAEIADGEIDVLADTTQDKIYAVADLVDKSVVGITSYLDTTGQALGSGVVYRHDESTDTYYVITNHHVVEDGNNFKIVFCNESKVTGTLLGYDADVDIAVLSFSGSGLENEISLSPLGDSDALEKGTIVLAAGNPQGYDFYGSLTMGVLSGLDRDLGNGDVTYLQHDASINAGNSGGPLYNLDGYVIGINVSKMASEDIEGMGFAIPINTVKAVVETIVPTD